MKTSNSILVSNNARLSHKKARKPQNRGVRHDTVVMAGIRLESH